MVVLAMMQFGLISDIYGIAINATVRARVVRPNIARHVAHASWAVTLYECWRISGAHTAQPASVNATGDANTNDDIFRL